MPYYFYVWTDEIIQHLAEHELTPEDFEYVLANPTQKGVSDSSGLPAVWGYTEQGRFVIAIYRELDSTTLLPITAYDVPEPRVKKRKHKR